MKNLFSIGEVAKQQNISRQTLIFYDKIGLFRPAYVDPATGYRYYSVGQLDYLDTICIMKKIGFSLDEIKAHMKSYTIDNSIVAFRKQLDVIGRKIEELQMLKSRVEHRCLQLEHSLPILDNSNTVCCENTKQQYILLQKVAAPHTLESASIATKECFARAFQEKLPIFFQSGAIVPLECIQKRRYTEASLVFLPIEKTTNIPDVVALPPENAYPHITPVIMSRLAKPTNGYWNTVSPITCILFRILMNLQSMTIFLPGMKMNISPKLCSM